MSEPAARVLPWTLPQVNGPVVGRSRRVEDLQALEREAWDLGYAQGHEAGVAAVRREQQAMTTEIEQRVRRLGSMLECLSRPLQDLDEEVHRQLVSVAGGIARQIVRRELKTQPDQIIAAVREAVALLPIATREVRVFLHPDDAALVRERLAEPSTDRAWTIVEDPVLTRGGCRVTSEYSTIDARLEQRIGAAVAAILGDERSAESAP